MKNYFKIILKYIDKMFLNNYNININRKQNTKLKESSD